MFKMYFLFFSFRGLVKAGHFDQGGHRVYTECENNRRVNALLSQSTVSSKHYLYAVFVNG